jgi:hypothetical protein
MAVIKIIILLLFIKIDGLNQKKNLNFKVERVDCWLIKTFILLF